MNVTGLLFIVHSNTFELVASSCLLSGNIVLLLEFQRYCRHCRKQDVTVYLAPLWFELASNHLELFEYIDNAVGNRTPNR